MEYVREEIFFFCKGSFAKSVGRCQRDCLSQLFKKEWKHLFSFSVKRMLPLGASSIPFQHPVHIRS